MKKSRSLWIAAFAAVMLAVLIFTDSHKVKYTHRFLGAFDTVIEISGYTESESEFKRYAAFAEDEFMRLSKLYDRFFEYEGITNVAVLNREAAKSPVKVDEELFELIEFSCEINSKADKFNIALGSVSDLWHDFISLNKPFPNEKILKEAAAHTDTDDIVLNREDSTVYFKDELLKLDVGAVAKGFAAEKVAEELTDKGLKTFLINAGGNIVARTGSDMQEGFKWEVGVQNPFYFDSEDKSGDKSLTTVKIRDGAVVTSGDYQRFREYEGRRYHHIIDSETLYPADYMRGVTVICENSGVADALSTAFFCMDYESGSRLAESFNAGIFEVFKDGSVKYNDAFKNFI